MWFLGRKPKHPTNWKLIAFLMVALLSFKVANTAGERLDLAFADSSAPVALTGGAAASVSGQMGVNRDVEHVLKNRQNAVENLTVLHSIPDRGLSWLRWGPVFAWCFAATCGAIWLFYLRPKRLETMVQ